MVSSKGEPTDPKLREEVKEEVKQLEKGGGPGSWSAWKAGELSRRYEARGGGYKDTGDNKNKAQKGPPEKKGEKNGGKTSNKKDESENDKKDEGKSESKDDKKDDKKDEKKEDKKDDKKDDKKKSKK